MTFGRCHGRRREGENGFGGSNIKINVLLLAHLTWTIHGKVNLSLNFYLITQGNLCAHPRDGFRVSRFPSGISYPPFIFAGGIRFANSHSSNM